MFGKGFLVSWNDIEAAVETEYRSWHSKEHMPERLSIPGFTLGRRYIDLAAPANRYLTVYEACKVDIFASEAYRSRLASPSPATTRMSLKMKNFVRRICRTVASNGMAIGGAAVVIRLQRKNNRDNAAAAALTQALYAENEAAAAHFGTVDDQMSSLRSDRLQSHMSASAVAPFNAVLFIETDSRDMANRFLANLKTIITRSMPDASLVSYQIYDLALVYRPLYVK